MSVPFAPIAIVGQACVLPGALTPAALWQLVLAGRTVLAAAPPGRWGIARDRMLGTRDLRDRAASDAGGYVEGFERGFDPSGFAISPGELAGLDPLVHWLVHAGREALRDARYAGDLARAGAVIGNLSYPSSSLSRFAERVWLAGQAAPAARDILDRLDRLRPDVDPRNRFMSGLPAHLLARALGLGRGGFALDAACASSLYAIKLACDALHDGRADLMLAGAVNRADDLFLHAGFTALGALSPTGRSQPFCAGADGLVPAEGAVLVALRRLADAERDGDRILGVIRGVGLANDGRARGLLAPSEAGQLRALRAAYRDAGIAPDDISLLECHATGTVVGDAVEVGALSRMFAGRGEPLPIGSLKANLGHLITAAGGAALLKVLGALAAHVLPPTPGTAPLTGALDGAPLRVVRAAEPWPAAAPRRAAISAFGFGGNNAHLLVEEAPRAATRRAPRAAVASTAAPGIAPGIAIVSLGARVADGNSVADFAEALFTGRTRVIGGCAAATQIALELAGLKFPPKDLDETLPQQLLLFAAAREAVHGVVLPGDRTAVFVGMQCDAEIARHGARWRTAEWSAAVAAPDGWLAAARDGWVPLLGAAGVIGAMPNIVANRLSSQLDLHGPSLAVSAEELSGITALMLARRGLERGEIDAALVGAVDLCVEPVHLAAARAVLSRGAPGDAAVVMVMKRLDDARRDGDRVLAVLGDAPGDAPAPGDALALGDGGISLAPLFGHAHCASGLVHVAAAALCCAHRALPPPPGAHRVVPWTAAHRRRASVHIAALGDAAATVELAESPDAAAAPDAIAVATGIHDAAGDTHFLAALRATARVPQPPILMLRAHWPAPQLPPFPPRNPTLPRDLRIAPGTHVRIPDKTIMTPTPLDTDHLEPVAQPAVPLTVAAIGTDRLASVAPSAVSMTAAAIGTDRLAAVAQPAVRIAFSRAQLELHASGQISQLFGAMFAPQDAHALQVRMPEPPLLLADRVTNIAAEAGSMRLGTVWTETDVRADSWYLHRGFMPAGIMIEAGQADLFLISYLGIDLVNQGRRAYRLLGCELTYGASLPRAGDTLRYEICIDGHARHGDVRLFFFHYDCTIVRPDGSTALGLSVRHGQAGLFSRDELDASAGVLWSPDDHAAPPGRVDPPAVACAARAFSPRQVRAFADGDLYGCFGRGFELGQTHVRSPAIQGGQMRLIDEVVDLDPAGGPWRRGYLKATTAIHADDWFFTGHFKNDPCMPGTLMFEGCLQAMAFYLAALGHTLGRDGWRFEPVVEQAYRLSCRGQVVPSSRQLVCELFVHEVHDGPFPTVFGDLLGTVDGRKAFHARRVGLRLVPDWPLSSLPAPADPDPARPVACTADGFRFDHASLLACAWGQPSRAFGPMYARFDGTRRVARLPGPPYHVMSRVTHVTGELGAARPGATATIEYDVPPDAWYFGAGGHPTMPFCVLLEVVLQPCGWLASYIGSALLAEHDLVFRNLDGNGRMRAEVPPGTSRLRTTATVKSIARSGGMILESFEVRCWAGAQLIYELDTGFGFFPAQALDNQIGLPVSPAQRALLDAPSSLHIALADRPPAYFAGPARLPDRPLLMLDRITAFDPRGGHAGLGFLRGEKDVDPAEWFFQAHFFQDPVQPGSLGVEAMLQLLQLYLLHTGLAAACRRPRFEPIALGRATTWKYRGQVVPSNRLISVTLEITERGHDAGAPYAVADASLWVDGKRIYAASQLAMRIVEDPRPADVTHAAGTTSPAGATSPADTGDVRGRRTTDSTASIEPPPPTARERLAAPAFLPEVRAFWRDWFGVPAPLVDDLHRGLIGRFTRHLAIEQPAAVRAALRRGALLVGNHQTAIESTSFAIIASALAGQPLVTLAKIENRDYWLTRAMQHAFRHPGLPALSMTQDFDRNDPGSLAPIMRQLAETIAQGRSVMVHVEGTRALSCRSPVQRMSGTFVDMALAVGCPIIPVRFFGGLPAAPVAERLEFPLTMGRQDILLGRPIRPDELADRSYLERTQRVLAAINGLGPPNHAEAPLCPDPAFEASVRAWMARTGATLGHAALYRLLEELPDPSPATAALTRAAHTGQLVVPATPEGHWLAELARRLFGDTGPRVSIAGDDHAGGTAPAAAAMREQHTAPPSTIRPQQTAPADASTIHPQPATAPLPTHDMDCFAPEAVSAAAARIREPAHILRDRDGRLGVVTGQEHERSPDRPYDVVGILPPIDPGWLGDRGFTETHHLRFPYVAGEMANGIATPGLVVAMARAGMLGFFGAAGLPLAAVERGLDDIERAVGDGSWGANLIHAPSDPAHEAAVADLFVRRGVRRICASAFMALTPAVVRCAASGLTRDASGRVVRRHHIFAKVSRPEVAQTFLAPAPPPLLTALARAGLLTADEVALAAEIPIADDLTVEADSGGHTDNRPLGVLLPVMLALRDDLMRTHRFARDIRIGAAGGLGTPAAVASAFALGAAYVVTGSVNQAAVESGLSVEGRRLLADAALSDVIMAPAADMFEMGVKVQVLRRGTLFGVRALRLHELYRGHDSLEAMPAAVKQRLEREILGASCDAVWADVERHFQARDPRELARAAREPKHRMALIFRWYLGMSSRWAIDGNPARRLDYQIWCGPAMGAFNTWVKGSFLEPPEQRTVVQIARNLLEGAAAITRAQQLRSAGLAVPPVAFRFTPRPLADER